MISIRIIGKIIVRIVHQTLNTIQIVSYAVIDAISKTNPNVENCFITCSERTDGVGAQLQARLSTMLVSQEFQIVYIHTPFEEIEHIPELVNRAEVFFNLGESEIIIDDVKISSLNIIHINNPKKLRKKSNTLYVIPHCHTFADAHPNCYLNITNKFIKKYKSSPKKNYKLFYEKDKINIAIHIRRGDVSRDDSNRFTDNLYYKYLLYNLLSIFDELNLKVVIHLYSQGSILNFSELKEFNINYHLDECVFTTFYNLTSADVLIMSKSSFSYSAALLSKNIKIYEPFWHQPLDSWIITDWHDENKKVVFDKSNFKKRVRRSLI